MLLERTGPRSVVPSVPGVEPVLAAQIFDPARSIHSPASALSGFVPRLNASGLDEHHTEPDQEGDALPHEALFMAADHAHCTDPTSPRSTTG